MSIHEKGLAQSERSIIVIPPAPRNVPNGCLQLQRNSGPTDLYPLSRRPICWSCVVGDGAPRMSLSAGL